MGTGTLYVVATPIGNLNDITLRALEVLRSVDVIACEDTRHTRVLLDRHGIRTPLVSYHEHNEDRRAPELLARLKAGQSVALVSDAGTPVLSDPGFVLVRRAVEEGIPVVPVPGPSAITAALSVAGLPPDRFAFVGFLPRRRAQRRRLLQEVAALPWTLVAFEAPHRIQEALEDVVAVLGDRPVALVREMTKTFEQVIRGRASEVLAAVRERPPRGELTLVVGGAPPAAAPGAAEAVRALLQAGRSVREAAQEVARTCGLSRREAYRLALEAAGRRVPGRDPPGR
ncbi:MAG: 16S rRNA (cytidine(1402)-2'-O)-methyltransferase [Armatimonadota bacterium]|nr:16S rRNA (cytidine(1402)-2'-O)-methyltransferase [Armatimonadota bacterium]MDR7401797.1 16S rRNA (cytidine(1402)-2'-O)-methyltransferase [Armatimonadota bacterium]MDR7403099.1 16S rRNA (cytidine(1402)-2'-O)-methyltransferase [Armatimonadota bacterium]MDR7436198.1 16S rRNA (cytidine(1402)-2'-O)-methyltransferase [Armatimonadota bacterium]MDR7471421.1 16S rRNA (cytidine(1402)-2'-O)-methyltransferase [Armatimonadota bacterium]